MKDSRKIVKSEPDFNYFSSDLPCKKHPSNSSSVGICAYCLNEKLMKLVCSDCGEQRLSSCCCSDVSSSYRNSSCTLDVGSVGRISFLIENEKSGRGNGDDHKTLFSHMKKSETGDVVLLKRSNSCVVEVKKSNGFWRIGKLFKKKREKEDCSERNRGGFDQKDEVWMSDCVMDVSRSRSLSSFTDRNFDHEVTSMAYSSAKVSDFNESEPGKSGFRGRLMDFEGGFPAKETDFIRRDDDDDDDDEFIDLKLDLSDKSTTEQSVYDPQDSIGSSSCRITVNERGIKKVKNSHMKALKWIFKHHPGKKDLNHILES